MQRPCPYCGALLRPGARFCGTCGKTMSASPNLPAVQQAVAAALPAYLTAVDGRLFSLALPVISIGRGPLCAVQIADGSVSGSHAEIECRGNRYIVRDLGSTNGTHINGARIMGDAFLTPGDQVAFGNVVFTFRQDPPGASVPSPTQAVSLAGPGAAPPLAQIQPPGTPWHQGFSPAPAIPYNRPDWGKHAPELEGRILHVDGPYQEKLSMWAPMATTGCLALLFTGCLAPLAPLAFLPMFGQRDITVYHLRLEEECTGAHKAAKIRGDISTAISQGDTVALWGKWDSGTLLVKKAYNCNTAAYLKVKGVF